MDGEKNERRSGWQVEKSISITHILTTISAIVSAMIFISTLNTRLSILESALSTALISQQGLNQKHETQLEELRKLTREDYKTISDKLDRLMERMVDRK